MSEKTFTNESLLNTIREDFPGFDEDEILDYIKFVIPNIHFFLRSGKEEPLNKYCSKEIINKALDNKNEFRITPDIDTARVGYARIDDYKNGENEICIKVYTSIFFYDNVVNNQNIEINSNFDKYWNDIWVITLKGNFGKDIMTNCPFCGNQMNYNHNKHMFTCENCKDSIYYSKVNWKITDIEVNKVSYK